jgi:hypothetical protein
LEKGILAELRDKPEPKHFRAALKKFQETAEILDELDKRWDELEAIRKKGEIVKEFEEALAKLLAEEKFERVSRKAKRFANVAEEKKEEKKAEAPLRSIEDLIKARKADLTILREQLKELIDEFKKVIPLAEKGEFASYILAGREGFSEKIQESVNLLLIYQRFYYKTSAATIAATMQVYPKGLQWLDKRVIK